MNLLETSWIPLVTSSGKRVEFSLADTLRQSPEVADLAVTPPQRVALMRLLLAIVQAALDGPENIEDWLACKNRIVPESLGYLNAWKANFDLGGASAFMQIPDLTVAAGKDKPLDILDCRLSSGNNATLFDQAASPDGRTFNDANIALNLITFLNFSTGGKVGQAEWQGKKYSDSTFAAPCIKSAHTFIVGNTLLDTLYFNLLCKEGDFGIRSFPNGRWGKPIWEQFPKSVDDEAAFENAGRTYLGRLVPLSRFVRIDEKGRCIVGPTHKSFKIEHLPVHREPSTTIKSSRKSGEPFYLPLSSEKHMWRELGAILAFKATGTGQGGAPALGKLLDAYYEMPEREVEIWVGGLETGAQAAKLSDMLEWRFRIPLSLLGGGTLQQYEKGVGLAEKAAWALGEAVKTCFKNLSVEAKKAPVTVAQTLFWTRLDRRHDILIHTANDPQASLSDRWYKVVKNSMTDAYDRVCPKESPRQIQAYTLGLGNLGLKKPD
ncbi:MAG: type I-E CRISPR-associated protein Cse1/CasA [Desulfatitalea sp.]|nr:type I-E CRISPR-associated protein Cse1/CasA [Desulfatitalea sp.]